VPKKTALILAGAVAKGAFEAGVIQELAARRRAIPIARIVGVSSGAINAAVYATGVRAGEEEKVAARLAALWQHTANWHTAVELDFKAILHLVGVGNGERVFKLMQETVADLRVEQGRPVTLRLVLATLNGEQGEIGGQPATTFEHVAEFSDDDFDREAMRDRIFTTALGSGAFPGVFAPVDVPGVGLCVDGGAVNNTPIKEAIDDGDVDRIVVVTAQPLQMHAPPHLSGLNLVSHFAEILIDERLYQDLRFAETVNGYLSELDALADQGVSGDVIAKVKAIFGWSQLEIIQIRPARALSGSAFSGFSSPALMAEYVQAGREAAIAAIGHLSLD
jgi:NTE family protein